MIFCSLASGSSGNCYYIGNQKHGLLIDVGISARRIKVCMNNLGLPIDNIRGILITHDHIDHTKASGMLARKLHLPIYATQKTWERMKQLTFLGELPNELWRAVEPQTRFEIEDFEIEAFRVSHDAADTVGYQLHIDGKSATVATDLGFIHPDSTRYFTSAELLVIESNYDEKMLLNGRYPAHLKARIKSDRGHLCNDHTAQFLAEHYHPGISHVLLGHLSADNNHPDVALNTLLRAFEARGRCFEPHTVVKVLRRETPSEVFTL